MWGLVVFAFEAVSCCISMGDVGVLSVTQTNKCIFESDVQVTMHRDIFLNLTFRRPGIVTYSYIKAKENH